MKMGRPSQGRTYKLQVQIPPAMRDWLERSAGDGCSISSVAFRILNAVQISEEKNKMKMLSETLEKFLESADFAEGCKSATKAAWTGSGYSVELFDGTWRVLWDNEIGNLYESSGVILNLPTLDDSDYQECVVNGEMAEDDFFFAVFQNDEEDLKQEMRDKLNS